MKEKKLPKACELCGMEVDELAYDS